MTSASDDNTLILDCGASSVSAESVRSQAERRSRLAKAMANTTWRRNLRKDTTSAALTGVYIGVIGPYLGLVAAKTLHAPVLLLSVMMAAPFLGNMVTPLWVHHLHGRPKLPFVIGPAVTARCLYLLMAFVRSAQGFVAVVCLAQFCEASTGPAYSAVMERIYPRSQRGRYMSSVRVMRSVVVMGITVAVGNVLDRWGFHQVFTAAAVFGLASSIVFSTVEVPPDQDEMERAQPPASAGEAWRIFREDHAYRQFALAAFVYGFGNLLLNPIYPLFVDRTLHITYAQQGLLSLTGSIAAVVGFVFWGRYIDRYGAVRAVFVSIGIVALKPFLYYLAPSFQWLVPAAIMDGISNAGIELGYINCILSFSPPTLVPSYQSLHATLLGIRGVAAPFAAGLLVTVLQSYHLGLRPAFLVSGAMILTGFWMGRKVERR